jgi:hypothetical protein
VAISAAVTAVHSDVRAADVSVGIPNGCMNHLRVNPDQVKLNLPCVSLKPKSIITKIGANSHGITENRQV